MHYWIVTPKAVFTPRTSYDSAGCIDAVSSDVVWHTTIIDAEIELRQCRCDNVRHRPMSYDVMRSVSTA